MFATLFLILALVSWFFSIFVLTYSASVTTMNVHYFLNLWNAFFIADVFNSAS